MQGISYQEMPSYAWCIFAYLHKILVFCIAHGDPSQQALTFLHRSLQPAAAGSLHQDSTASIRSFKGTESASGSSSWEKQLRKKFFVSIQRYKVSAGHMTFSQ